MTTLLSWLVSSANLQREAGQRALEKLEQQEVYTLDDLLHLRKHLPSHARRNGDAAHVIEGLAAAFDEAEVSIADSLMVEWLKKEAGIALASACKISDAVKANIAPPPAPMLSPRRALRHSS